MSNLMINWRFWVWHLQVVHRRDWQAYRFVRAPIVRWSRNFYHARGGPGRSGFWMPVAFYTGRRYAVALALLIGALVWWAL